MWSPCSCAAATISGSTLQSRMNCINSSGLVVFILSNIGWHSGLVVLILSQYSKIRARLLARDGQWRRWWWRSPTVSVSGWSWQNSDFPVPKWETSFSVLKRPDKYFAWIQALLNWAHSYCYRKLSTNGVVLTVTCTLAWSTSKRRTQAYWLLRGVLLARSQGHSVWLDCWSSA